MAEPTNPVDPTEAAQIAQQTGQSIDQVNASLQAHEKILRSTTTAQTALNTESQDYSAQLSKLQARLGDFGVTMQGVGNSINQQSTAFGLLTAGLLTTKEKFNQFYQGIDNKRLGSFTDQTQALVDTLGKGGSIIGSTTDAGKKLIGMLGNMGVGGKALASVMSMTSEGLAAFAKNVITGADNTLKFQGILMQGAASGGAMQQLYDGIDESFEGIGDNLERLNKISGQFIAIQADAADATGLSSDELSKYTAVLVNTPAGLEAMSKGIDIANTHMNTLAAVTQLAQGAGLNIAQTYQDINKVIIETGMNYEGATGFATRFADVSKDLHARTDDVRDALLKSSNAFKLWNTDGEQSVKMNQGLADSVKNYARALEAAGVPAANALEMATKQTQQLGQLNEAQESLISQSAGGAGGIKGALQYEELLKKDPVAAQKMATQSFENQIGGKAITREEALATGQEDKYMLERKLLMSGSLGMKADSTAEAEDMLAAMSKGVEYKKSTKEDVASTAAAAIGKGQAQEKLTYTGIKEANLTAERVMLTAGNINAGTLEKAFSAGTGESVNAGHGMNTTAQNLLTQRMNAGATGPGSGQDPIGASAHAIGKMFDNAKTLASTGMTSVKQQLVGPGATPNLGGTGTSTSASTPDMSTLTDAQMAKVMEYSRTMGVSEEDALKKLSSPLKDPNERPGFPMLGGASMAGQTGTGYVPAGRQVGASVSTKSTETGTTGGSTSGSGARGGIGASAGTGAGSGAPIPVTLVGGALTMNLTGACPHCKAPITTSLQSQATNVAANTGHT